MSKRKRPWKPFDPSAGPWLIWSYHWNCWHVRNADGGASGYTDDILRAGVFEEQTARGYHDPPPHRRDEAIPAVRAIKDMRRRLAALTDERDAFAENVARVEATLLKDSHND